MSTTSTVRPVVSVKPVVLPAPGRGDDVGFRITAPADGSDLPVLLFSHGFGGSLEDYAPLVDRWAAAGFAVVQPTHLDSRSLALPPGDPRQPRIWRQRVSDLTLALDHLDVLAAALPGDAPRLDPGHVAAVGHSYGGQTVGLLLGARVLDADGRAGEDLADHRITAGVLLTTTGTGESLTPFAAENFPFMRPDFSGLTTPTLVVAGDHDQSLLSTRGPDWFTDPFTLSPGATDLLTVFGAEHSLGGITGYSSAHTTDEHPGRVRWVADLTTAYLRTALHVDGDAWAAAVRGVHEDPDALGSVTASPVRAGA